MARPPRNQAPDLSQAMELTSGAIERLVCPPGKQQAFLRDTKARGLSVRVTAAGAKSFVFEAKLNRQTIRRTLGDAMADGALDRARKKAHQLRVQLDDGEDPREADRQRAAEAAARALTVADLWPRYLAEGRPKRKQAWKPRYRADLEAMAAPGGLPKLRGVGTTRPGPLYPLMALPLTALTEDVLLQWFEREALAGRHQATRALMMFRGFLRWAAVRPEYRQLIDRDVGKAAAIVEALPPNTKRTDALESAQVAGWWGAVTQLANPTISAYLRALLLTGARREEMAALRWTQVDFRWRKLTLADKIDATREIPLSDYLAGLLDALPRGSEFVFAAAGKAGHVSDVRTSHARVLQQAGIERLTLHGLRRSFSLLGEAAGAPAGAIAQIMGHKPSATAEGYRPRSIDALRPFLAQIEAHILRAAGVPEIPAAGLRLVAASA